MKREVKTQASAGQPVPPKDTKTWEPYPLLVEHLTHTRWDDGKERQVSTLTFTFVDGSLNCCLNDREESRGMFVTADTFREALKALEANLEGGGSSRWVQWKKWKK